MTTNCAKKQLDAKSASLAATVLVGASPDDYNDIGAEDRVKPMKTVFEVKDGKVLLPPHSLTCLELVGCGSVRPECR